MYIRNNIHTRATKKEGKSEGMAGRTEGPGAVLLTSFVFTVEASALLLCSSTYCRPLSLHSCTPHTCSCQCHQPLALFCLTSWQPQTQPTSVGPSPLLVVPLSPPWLLPSLNLQPSAGSFAASSPSTWTPATNNLPAHGPRVLLFPLSS